MRFMVARTGSGRPSLMHAIHIDDFSTTTCGLDVSRWSRFYVERAIPQVLCKRCARILDLETA